MSWINDLKDLFSRTETEKQIDEAVATAEGAYKITAKMNDFGREYSRISTNTALKNATDGLLNKIGLRLDSTNSTTNTTN